GIAWRLRRGAGAGPGGGIAGGGGRGGGGGGGKRRALRPAPGLLLPLLPFLPHQEAVGEHHRHGVAVEARPQPPLILVPAQQPLGLLVILLHPVPPVRVAHHLSQRCLRAQVGPVVTPLAVAAVLPDQPARPPPAVGSHPPAPPPPPPPAPPPPTTAPSPHPSPPAPRRPPPQPRRGCAATSASARCPAAPRRRLRATRKSPRTAAT